MLFALFTWCVFRTEGMDESTVGNIHHMFSADAMHINALLCEIEQSSSVLLDEPSARLTDIVHEICLDSTEIKLEPDDEEDKIQFARYIHTEYITNVHNLKIENETTDMQTQSPCSSNAINRKKTSERRVVVCGSVTGEKNCSEADASITVHPPTCKIVCSKSSKSVSKQTSIKADRHQVHIITGEDLENLVKIEVGVRVKIEMPVADTPQPDLLTVGSSENSKICNQNVICELILFDF